MHILKLSPSQVSHCDVHTILPNLKGGLVISCLLHQGHCLTPLAVEADCDDKCFPASLRDLRRNEASIRRAQFQVVAGAYRDCRQDIQAYLVANVHTYLGSRADPRIGIQSLLDRI